MEEVLSLSMRLAMTGRIALCIPRPSSRLSLLIFDCKFSHVHFPNFGEISLLLNTSFQNKAATFYYGDDVNET